MDKKKKTMWIILGCLIITFILFIIINSMLLTFKLNKLSKDMDIRMADIDSYIQEEKILRGNNTIQPIEQNSYICTSNYYDCGDFDSGEEATRTFNYCGGKDNDVHWLDGDDDSEACETYRY